MAAMAPLVTALVTAAVTARVAMLAPRLAAPTWATSDTRDATLAATLPVATIAAALAEDLSVGHGPPEASVVGVDGLDLRRPAEGQRARDAARETHRDLVGHLPRYDMAVEDAYGFDRLGVNT